jgi:hypothetical protein
MNQQAPQAPQEQQQAAVQDTAQPQQEKPVKDITKEDIRNELNNQREMIEKLQSVVKEEKVSTLAGAGITTDIIEAWKSEHGPIEALTINGQIYVYRGIRRLELEKIQEDTANAKGTLREDMIAERCTLYPKLNRVNFPQGAAGLPTTLADRITNLSGFEFEEEIPVRL